MSFHLKTVIKKAVFYFKSKNSFLTVCLVFFAKSETDSISELIFTRSFSPPKLCFVNKFFLVCCCLWEDCYDCIHYHFFSPLLFLIRSLMPFCLLSKISGPVVNHIITLIIFEIGSFLH